MFSKLLRTQSSILLNRSPHTLSSYSLKVFCSTACPTDTGTKSSTCTSPGVVPCLPLDRDLSMWRRPVRQPDPDLRLGIFAGTWFDYMYSKLGAIGPYSLYIGIITVFFSKEIYVHDHEDLKHLQLLIIVLLIFHYGGGPYVHKFLDNRYQKKLDEFVDMRENAVASYEQNIKDALFYYWSNDGQMDYLLAKRENVALQLETVYRQRVIAVYTAVKSRLDYQVELYFIDKRFKHRNMVEWIMKEVMKSITPAFVKNSVDTSIESLELLASRA